MPAFITNAVQVQRFADALFNVAVGTSTMAQVTADITASGGLDNALNSYYSSSFTGVPTTTVAANMCTYLGIVAGSNGLVAADVTTAQNYITGTLNAAAANARGAAVKGILNNLASLTSDKVFGAVATKFNSDIDKATAYTGVSDIAAGTAPAPVLNTTFALTTGSNSFTGTSGDDTFDAGLSTGSLQTLNSGDRLDGGLGTDELFAVVNGSATPSALTSVENISISSITNAATLDLTNATGLRKVVNQGSSTALTLSGIAATVNVTIQDTAIAGQTVTYSGVSGTADSATITLQNVTGAATLTAGGIETLNIVTAGTAGNALANLTDANTATLNISGSSSLNVTLTGAAAVRTINASGLSGVLTVAPTTALAATVTGGSGNDGITLTRVVADSVDGGAGNDTITFTGAGTLTITDTISGGDGIADVLVGNITDLLALTSATTSLRTGLERITVSDALGGGSLTTANVQAGIERVTLATLGTGTLTLDAGARTVALTAATNALTINDTGVATTDTLTITNGAAATNVFGGVAYTINGFETVTFDTSGTGAVTAQTTTTVALAPDGGTSTLNISGSNGLTTTGITANVINASGLTGAAALTMNAAAVSVTSITGSLNADLLVGDSSSSISGGAGNDTITGGTGNDTLLGGDGVDTITNSGGAADSVDAGAGNDIVTATLTAGNTISGGDGIDVLSLAAAGTAATASGVSLFETARLTAAFTQDMAVFLDNPTFTRLEVTNAVAAVYSNVGSLVTTAASNTALSSLTATRLVDTTTNSINLIALGNATTSLFQVNDEETINLSSSSAVGAVIITTLTDTDLSTLNITGSNAITIGTLSANSTTTGTTLTINAAANTGGISVSAVNSIIAASITGSAAGSNALLTGTGGADTIVGGGAADTITGGLSADILTGGAGTDTFIFANTDNGTPSATNWDTITDYGSASDVIDHSTATLVVTAGGTIGAGVAVISASGIATFNIADSTLALRLIAVAAAIAETGGAAAAGEVAAFQFGSDAYVFISDGTNAVSSTDSLIKLTGISLTSTAYDVVTIAGGNMTLA